MDAAVALPICCAKGGAPVGYLLAGVSPRKRLDTQYSSFFAQVADDFGEAVREALMVQREAALLAQQEAERTRLNDLFQQAPAGILMLHGPQHQVVLVNPGYLRLVGRRQQSDLLGKPIAEALPEIVEQGFIQLLDEVYRTGKPFHGNEVLIHLNREESGQDGRGYFNFVYQHTPTATAPSTASWSLASKSPSRSSHAAKSKPAKNNSAFSLTRFRKWHGWATPMATCSGTTTAGTITLEPPSKRCAGGDGNRCMTPISFPGSSSAINNPSPPEPPSG